MNKLGVHAFVWEHGWSKEQATRAINRTAEAGYDFIEAPSLDPSSIDPAVTTRLLEAAGIGIAFSMGLDFDADISSGDPDKEKRGKALLLDAVSVCRDCGGTLDRRHPLLGLRQVPHPADRARRRPLRRHPARGGRGGGAERHRPLPRGGEPLRDQHPQHRRPGRRDVPAHRRPERQGPPRRLPHEHRGIGHPLGDRRHRALARLLPHRRQPPRLPRLRLDRPRRRLPRPRAGELPGPDHLRELLDPRRRPAARRHPRHLAQPLGGRLRPRHARADVHQGAAQGRAGGPAPGRAQPAPGAAARA